MISRRLSCKLANASLLAAMGVVAIHLPKPQDPEGLWALIDWFVPGGICKVSVPFFFLVSGFFLAARVGEAGWWKTAVRKRVRSLLVPYLIWALAFAVFVYVARRDPISQWLAVRKWLVFGLDPTDVPLLTPLWYLRTLMTFVLVSPLLVLLLRLGRPALGFLYLFSVGFAVCQDLGLAVMAHPAVVSFYQLFRPEGLFYFTLGMWLGGKTEVRKSGSSEVRNDGRVERWNGVSALFTFSLLLFTFLLLALRRHLALYSLDWTVPYPAVVPFAMYAFWRLVPAYAWPKSLTSLAFPVFLMHFFVTHVGRIAFASRGDDVAVFALTYLAAIGFSAVAAMTLRRFLPRIASVLFGGR